MTPLRFALVGNGAWGRNYIAAGAMLGEQIVVVPRSGYLSLDMCDAVVVATHPCESVDIAIHALAAGKPVLIEKPAGLSLRDAERLAEVEAQTGGLVLVGHQHLHSEGMERLRHRAELDLSVRAEVFFGGPGPVRDYPALWDYGPHAVSAALTLLGSGDVVATRAVEGSFVVAGERGHVRCRVGANWERRQARVVSYGAGTYDGHGPQEPPLTRQVRAFARAVRAREAIAWCALPWQFGARWAVDVARVLEATER